MRQSHNPTRVNLDLGLCELTPLPHIRKLFFTNLLGVFCAYKFNFELTILLSGQSVVCTFGFVLQSDWYHHSKVPEVDFSPGYYQALSLPPFLMREPATEARTYARE